MRGPSAVLVHRDLHAASLGLLHDALAEVQVRDEGFLAEDVLACIDHRLEHGCALRGVRSEVEHLYVVPGEERVPVLADFGVGVESLLQRAGLRDVQITEDRHVVARGAVSAQVLDGYPAAAHEADPRPKPAGSIGR